MRLLDIATGAGDIPLRLWRRAKRHRIYLEIDACDVSERALEMARQRAANAHAPIRFFLFDALRDQVRGEYDIIVTSTFLHHLQDEAAVALLRQMKRATRKLLLVNDLRRCALGLAAAFLGTRILSTSKVVHIDGPRSVRAAHTLSEVQSLAVQAGLVGATVDRRWPWRYLLQWRRP